MKVAIFDFDGTLFPLETIPFLISQYRKQGYGTLKVIKLYMGIMPLLVKYKVFKSIDKEMFRESAVYEFLKLFHFMSEIEVKGFFDKNIDFMFNSLTKEVVDEVIKAKEDGFETVLLSGCFTGILNPIGKRLGFDHIIGTQLRFNNKDNNLYDVHQQVDVIAGARKAEVMIPFLKNYDLKASKAFADSYYDREVLELVGIKVAVNPDNQLNAIAKKNNWTILKTTNL